MSDTSISNISGNTSIYDRSANSFISNISGPTPYDSAVPVSDPFRDGSFARDLARAEQLHRETSAWKMPSFPKSIFHKDGCNYGNDMRQQKHHQSGSLSEIQELAKALPQSKAPEPSTATMDNYQAHPHPCALDGRRNSEPHLRPLRRVECRGYPWPRTASISHGRSNSQHVISTYA